jgi:hypothetical protein
MSSGAIGRDLTKNSSVPRFVGDQQHICRAGQFESLPAMPVAFPKSDRFSHLSATSSRLHTPGTTGHNRRLKGKDHIVLRVSKYLCDPRGGKVMNFRSANDLNAE